MLDKTLGPLSLAKQTRDANHTDNSYNGVVKSVTEVCSDLDRVGFLRIFYLEVSSGQITGLARESKNLCPYKGPTPASLMTRVLRGWDPAGKAIDDLIQDER